MRSWTNHTYTEINDARVLNVLIGELCVHRALTNSPRSRRALPNSRLRTSSRRNSEARLASSSNSHLTLLPTASLKAHLLPNSSNRPASRDPVDLMDSQAARALFLAMVEWVASLRRRLVTACLLPMDLPRLAKDSVDRLHQAHSLPTIRPCRSVLLDNRDRRCRVLAKVRDLWAMEASKVHLSLLPRKLPSRRPPRPTQSPNRLALRLLLL